MPETLSGLTGRGRCFLAAGLLVCLAALAYGNRDVLRVGILLLALPLVSSWVVVRTRYRLASARVLGSPRVAAGHPVTVTLRLDNVSRLPSGLLLVEDRVPFAFGVRPRFVLERVEPRGRREVAYVVTAAVRGRYPLGPLTLRLTDAFGMCELARSFTQRDNLLVTPQVHALPAVSLRGDWAGSGESHSRSLAAAGEDDAGTREYRHGDDLRRVHWRSTARLGELMVRREEQPWQSRCSVLVDTRLRAHAGEGPASSLEWAISAAASVALDLDRRGYQVRLVTDTGTSLPSASRGRDGRPHGFAEAVLDALAVVPGSGNDSLAQAGSALRRAGTDGLLVAVLGRVDPSQAQQLAQLRRGATVAVAVLLDTARWAPVRSAAVAGAARDHSGATRLLRAAGWRVVEAGPQDTIAQVWPRATAEGQLAGAAARAQAYGPVGSAPGPVPLTGRGVP
jgi:uncharacterized protein (DUF58 family)